MRLAVVCTAVYAVTYVAAHSLGLSDRKGALVPGHDADFLVHVVDISHPRYEDHIEVSTAEMCITVG